MGVLKAQVTVVSVQRAARAPLCSAHSLCAHDCTCQAFFYKLSLGQCQLHQKYYLESTVQGKIKSCAQVCTIGLIPNGACNPKFGEVRYSDLLQNQAARQSGHQFYASCINVINFGFKEALFQGYNVALIEINDKTLQCNLTENFQYLPEQEACLGQAPQILLKHWH